MHADVPSESCDVCSRYYDIPTRTCTPILPACVATSYQTGMPSATSDRPCTPLTMCKAWEVVSVEGTATTDRTCAFNDVVCAIGEYEVSAPTATSTRGCRAVTKCTLEQYQTRAATPTSDVACSQATSCGVTTGACVWGGVRLANLHTALRILRSDPPDPRTLSPLHPYTPLPFYSPRLHADVCLLCRCVCACRMYGHSHG